VLGAADPANPEYRARLTRLAETYWKPVYAYVRNAWCKTNEEAKDLTQGFFAHFLEKGYLARLRPELGSFRGYLKEALRHFLIDRARAEASRRPEGPLVRLDAADQELDRFAPASADETPEQVYDREWVRSVLELGIQDLQEALERAGKAKYFEVFRAYCLDAQGHPDSKTVLGPSKPMTYRELAEKLDLQETDVRNYLTYCRRLFRKVLHARIRDYVVAEEDVEKELAQVIGG